MEFDALSNQVIGCAIEVHRELGPGLLESTCEQCLASELGPGIGFKLQRPASEIRHQALRPLTLRVLRGGENSLDMRERC